MSTNNLQEHQIIFELMEFAEINWRSFQAMLKERGYEGNPEEDLRNLTEEMYK